MTRDPRWVEPRLPLWLRVWEWFRWNVLGLRHKSLEVLNRELEANDVLLHEKARENTMRLMGVPVLRLPSGEPTPPTPAPSVTLPGDAAGL